MDLQKLVDTLGSLGRDTRGQYHLTLGKLVDSLIGLPSDLSVVFDFDGSAPTNPHSYRGYYSDLAFESADSAPLVEEFLTVCNSTLSSTLTGYKGGDFIMDERTPLWASEYGTCSGRAILAIEERGEKAVIITKLIE